MKLIFLAWVREAIRRPTLALLSIVGVALGVATVVAVDIANESARKSFLAANEAVSGQSTHRIVGQVTDSLYRQLRVEQGLPVTPVVEGMVHIDGLDSPRIRLYGVDLLAELSEQSNATWNSIGIENAASLISNPFTVISTQETARELGWTNGDKFSIASFDGQYEMQLIGIISPSNPLQEQSLRYMLLTDIATAQAVLGMKGKLSAIHLAMDDSADLESFENKLPVDVYLESQSNRRQTQVALTRAFQINLTALGLLALLVAMFLIYNTTAFMVMRRRRTIGIVRALGALRWQVLVCVILEALCVGAIATLAGFFLGVQLSKSLLILVEQSIDTLYFPVTATVTVLSYETVVKAILLGIGATVISAYPVARTASHVPPSVASQQSRSEIRIPENASRLTIASAGLAVVGFVVLWVDQRSIVFGFAGIFIVIIAYLFAVPVIIAGIKRIARPLAKRMFGVQGTLATRAFSSTPGRTSIAIAVLCLAISSTVGVDIMVGSFRQAVDDWLSSRLTGDIYVTSPSQFKDGLKLEDVERIRELQNVESVGVAKWTKVPQSEGKVTVFAVDYGEDAFNGYQFKEKIDGALWMKFRDGGVIVSEPYAYRHQVRTGDSLTLFNGRLPVVLPIVGVFFDYSSDQGLVAMHRNTYLRHFDDETISSANVLAKPGTDLKELGDSVQQEITTPQARVWRNRELRDSSLLIFDQTFAITDVLRILAIIVAFIAVLSALATLQIEREKELGVLRSIGFTVKRIWSIASIETGIMGFLAGILSLPAGIIMAWLLIWVIEQRSFGWTMTMQIDPATLAQAVALSIVAALAAGVVPAWRFIRRVPVTALQSMD